jgi:hypothetical protein
MGHNIKDIKYKYVATLLDGTVVKGSYTGDGVQPRVIEIPESKKTIKVGTATRLNEVLSITIEEYKDVSNSN